MALPGSITLHPPPLKHWTAVARACQLAECVFLGPLLKLGFLSVVGDRVHGPLK